MDPLPTPETLVEPTRPMDASDALYLDTLCDRREAAMRSPFRDSEGLLDDEAADLADVAPEPGTPPAAN